MAEGPSVLLAAPVAGMVLKGSGIRKQGDLLSGMAIKLIDYDSMRERRVDHWLYLFGFIFNKIIIS